MTSVLHDEIFEQPEVIQRLLDLETENVAMMAATIQLRDPRYVVIAARGTSDNAAAHNRYIDMLHDKTFCPIQNRLTRPGFTYFGTMAMQ